MRKETDSTGIGEDDAIIIEEEHIQHIGIVRCGTVHMLKYDYWGTQTMLAYMGAGELFGEVFAVQKMNNSQVSFVAATDCQVLFLRAANIIHTCHRACPFHQKQLCVKKSLPIFRCRLKRRAAQSLKFL